jgi:hypothetical protein
MQFIDCSFNLFSLPAAQFSMKNHQNYAAGTEKRAAIRCSPTGFANAVLFLPPLARGV